MVVQRKTRDEDGYDALKLGFEPQKESRVSRSQQGEYKKAGVSAHRVMREFAADPEAEVNVGDSLTVSMFSEASHVDVVGISKGRGFQGVVKRHGMAGGRATHGGHSKRRPGAIGQASAPGASGRKHPGGAGHFVRDAPARSARRPERYPRPDRCR